MIFLSMNKAWLKSLQSLCKIYKYQSSFLCENLNSVIHKKMLISEF